MRNVTFYFFLGLSIVGGRETPLGQHGAYITKVKKGSIADTVGHLRPGINLELELCSFFFFMKPKFVFQLTVSSNLNKSLFFMTQHHQISASNV